MGHTTYYNNNIDWSVDYNMNMNCNSNNNMHRQRSELPRYCVECSDEGGGDDSIDTATTSLSSLLSSIPLLEEESEDRSITTRRRVHFHDSLVTEIHTRPRTSLEEKDDLYYTSHEIRHFKRKSEGRSLSLSSSGHHSSNSFWRSKVNWRWQSSSSQPHNNVRRSSSASRGYCAREYKYSDDTKKIDSDNTVHDHFTVPTPSELLNLSFKAVASTTSFPSAA